MPKVGNTMDNNSDDQSLIMQAKIEANRQDNDEKLTNITEYLAIITSTITSMMYQDYNSKSSPS